MTGRPLEGVGVLVTRPRPQVETLVAGLEALGAEVHVHPVIEIVPPEDDAPLRAALADLDGFDWIVLTSTNAVEAVISICPPPWPAGGCRVGVVGAATRRALESRGIRADLVPPEFTGESLARAMVERLGRRLEGCRILLPRAREGREELPLILGRHGADVRVVEAYRTAPCGHEKPALQACLSRGRIRLLTFASPSAVRAFDSLAGTEATRAIGAVCIGPVTAREAGSLGYRVLAVPSDHTAEGLIDAIRRALC